MPWAARSVVPIDFSISKVIIMTALRQQMENDMVLRGMAVRTRQSYIEAVRGLAKFYRRSPDAISVEEVQSYLLHLLKERGLSYSTCNLVTNGLCPHCGEGRLRPVRLLPPLPRATGPPLLRWAA